MKKFIILFILCAFQSIAQEKLSTSAGLVLFEASIPAFEEVKAANEKAKVLFNNKSGVLTTVLYVEDFKFKYDLMFRHFNDNYMESDRYPKAIFKGKIERFDASEITANFQEYRLKGKIQIHGQTRDLISIAKIRRTDKGLEMKMEFDLDASNFNIKIPALVRNKVSNKVKVTNNFILK